MILQSLIQRLLLGALLEIAVSVNYQKFYEKHQSSINLIKSVVFRDSFCNNLEISQNCYQKCLCWNVSIKEAHYLNKDFCNIDLNFLIIFFFMYKKLELIIGFIFLNNIFRHMQIFQKILKKENGRITKINQSF